MQLFARLMFNRVRIALQTVYMSFEQFILPLQAMQLSLQRLKLLAFLLVGRQAILTEDNVITQPNRQRTGSNGRNLSPADRAVTAHMANCGSQSIANPHFAP